MNIGELIGLNRSPVDARVLVCVLCVLTGVGRPTAFVIAEFT